MPTNLAGSVVPESDCICILFDPTDGRVVHTHRVITLPGGKKRTAEEVEKRALHMAEKMGIEASGLSFLHVAPEQFKASANQRVDLHSHSLVELPAPKPLRAYFGPRGSGTKK